MTRRLSTSHLVSTIAIATGMIASQSLASNKGFLGTGTVLPGSGSVAIVESTDTTDILVNSSSAVIDWVPDDNAVNNGVPITFLDSNGTVNFQGFSDFAVLNRLQVADNSRQILLNGAINSTIGQSVGGKIFFYSPSGFLVGSNATINVGSLVLSASPIAVDVNGGFISGGTVTFGQAPNTAATIATAAGSQINAYGSGSYVALVAPQITHRGTIRTDTASALVAAEAATITFSPDGLYNIQVTNGTDAATGIDIDGGTITRNSTIEGSGNHRAYLVAVARNDAVAMLVRNGGSVGFDTATSAAVEDNVVVLSGGYGVNGTPNIPSGTSTVGLTIDNATFSSDTVAVVSGSATITTSTGSTAFGNDLTLSAGDDSFIQAINGNTLSFGGTVSANVDTFGAGAITTGNLLRFGANAGSTLTVGGDAYLSAQSFGASAQFDATNAGSATGGTVIVQTGTGGTIDVAGLLDINVDGYGGGHNAFDGAAGNGTGGIGQILANGGTSSITVGGSTTISADGYGGSPGECSSCQITGGSGSGGSILVQAAVGAGNQIDLGTVTLGAIGQGGAGDVVGGAATGGTVQLASSDGGAIGVAGDLTVNVTGQGGFGLNNGVSGGTGGAATGGLATITFSGAASTIDLSGASTFNADAFGGFGVNGGAAIGGWVNLQASSAGTLTADYIDGSANAFGGSGATGGTAVGGRAWVQGITGGDIVVNDLYLSANAFAGQSDVGNGVAGTGGYVVASADNATLTVNNVLDLEANGRGGFADADGTTGGLGTGGQADVFADNGGSVLLNGTVNLDANGLGGDYISDASTGGNGVGGRVFFQASNGATLSAASNVILNAEGYGGFSNGDCNDCGGTGGNGTGGTVTVQAFGAGGTSIDVAGLLALSAKGYGSYGYAGAAGNGLGGTARVFVANGSALDLASDLNVTADGEGGSQDNGGIAGNGTGGLAEVATGVGNNAVDVTGVVDVSASGLGGNGSGSGSTGGAGRGGFARVLSQGGLINLAAGAVVRANGTGGSGIDGSGGDGVAGQARLVANGGDVTLNDDLIIDAVSTGGDGNFGGDAITFIGNDPQNTSTSDARLLATNGDIVVNGTTALNASASGGNGANGGNGGNASAGFVAVHARNSNIGPASITLDGVTIDASGFGGNGGLGTSGNQGSDGGNGGSGIGGFVIVTAAAGNGHLDVGDVLASASGFGGSGGDGGSGDGLSGGNGGDGGYGEGGFLNLGSESGLAEATGSNTGSANFASITATANASGGAGGDFAFGTPFGLAGDGGAAQGGLSFLIVRGAPVTVGDVLLDASATGGDSGLDQNEGFSATGGNATSGQVGVLVTNRLNLPLQRGSLLAGNIVGTADAFGGGGLPSGLARSSGGLLFSVLNSDATIASVSLTSNGSSFNPTSPIATPSEIAVSNGAVTVTGGLTMTTPGAISMWAHNGTLDAAAITVAADNFIHDNGLPVPLVPGTYTAGAISLTTGQDLIVDANLSSPSTITLTAPGLVDVRTVSSGNSVFGDAGNSFAAGDITATNGIEIASGGTATTGNLNAGTFVDIASSGGAIATGTVTANSGILLNALQGITTGAMSGGSFIEARAGGSILTGNLSATGGNVYLLSDADITTGTVTAATDAEYDAGGNVVLGAANVGGYLYLDATGNVTMANATAGETIDLLAGGTLTGGNMTAGDSVFALANGALTLGNVSAGIVNPSSEPLDGNVAIVGSNSSVQVGSMQAINFVGLASGGAATAGALQSGGDVMALVNGPATIASIANPNGRAYIAGFGMLAVGGGVDNFNPALVYGAANPIPSTGSVTITGATNTGRLDAFVGGNFTAGAVTAPIINARVGGLATINGLWQSPDVELWSNDIDIAASGGVEGGTDGTLTLVSTNATQALIGDGLTGSGYALSNAEFGRLSSGDVAIAARGDASAAIDMLIGNLTITGPLAGSTIDNPNGSVIFATGDPASQVASGVIRVTGNVSATGFQLGNALEFVTGRFDLNADTGSVLVEQSTGVLGGILDITADRIHVASGAILDRLAADPLYAGREDDLAAPTAVARPNGVIAADTIYVSPTNSVLVQNTGTAALRAGFRARTAELFPAEGSAPGSIELIVNGQLVTATGTLTGVDVRDALVEGLDLALYSANSSINGCLLTGACSGGGNSPFPPGFTPTPGIQDEVRLITRNLLPPPDFGNEDFIDDNDEATADGSTSPIKPPQPLFDTSALGDQGDVDDPVSGSGNPALMETPPPAAKQEQKP